MLFFDIGFCVDCTTATALQTFKCWLALEVILEGYFKLIITQKKKKRL
jgi:hypothetical protein